MKKHNYQLQLLCALLLLTSTTYAQSAKSDTAFVKASLAKAKDVYALSAVREQSHLYNGSEYIDYIPQGEENPYFLTNDWSNGTVIYNREKYENVPILYDISTDKLVAEHYSGAFIELITANVYQFEIQGHVFRWYSKSDDSRGNIKEGFYEVLYDGKTKVLAKRKKELEERIVSMELEKRFNEKNHYYILRNGAFYPVSSRKSVLQIFGGKPELKKFIRESKISFRRDKDSAFARVSEFYDKLNP